MESIRPTDLEPTRQELEALLDDEELRATTEVEIPDDVKEDLLEDVERRHEADEEKRRPEGSPEP